MAKKEKSIMVLRSMTEGEIKSYGGNLLMRRKWKQWLGLFVLSLAWVAVASKFLEGNEMTIGIIAIVPVLIVCVAWAYSMDKAGKRLWNAIKDKDQPVRL